MPKDQKPTTNTSGSVNLTLPMPVSSNAMYVPVEGRVVLSAAARTYYAEMYNIMEREGVQTLTGRLCVHMWVHEKDKRRRDINNLTKTLFDALQRCKVYVDDSQIDETHIYRGEISEKPYVRIEITTIAELDTRITVKVQKENQAKQDAFDSKLDVLSGICKQSEIKKISRFSRQQGQKNGKHA